MFNCPWIIISTINLMELSPMMRKRRETPSFGATTAGFQKSKAVVSVNYNN